MHHNYYPKQNRLPQANKQNKTPENDEPNFFHLYFYIREKLNNNELCILRFIVIICSKRKTPIELL